MVALSLRSRLLTIGVVITIALTATACAPEIDPADVSLADQMAQDSSQTDPALDEAVDPTDQLSEEMIPRAPMVNEQVTASEPIATESGPEVPTTASAPTPARTYVASENRMGIGNCPIYPPNNVFHADIRNLAKHPNSDQIITAMGNERVRAMGSVVWQGSRSGYPVNLVDSTTMPHTQFVKQGFLLMPEPIGSFPLPPNPRVEGYPNPAWDQHLLLFDIATCKSHELFLVRTPWLSFYRTWEADAAFTLDLTRNEIPFAASTVSGFSLLAGLVRYDEVASGSINHVIAVAFPKTSNLPAIWPATRSDGRNTDPNAPRIGTWLRLKDVDLDQFGPTAKVVVRALQKHGALIQDTNLADIAISGENDPRWDDADMRTLSKLSAADFEVVDPTPMMVSTDSYEIR